MCLHIVELGHSFVEAMPYQAGSSAKRIRIGLTGLAAAFIIMLIASAITPVPGGVGPMTVAMLLQNTVLAASARWG